MFFQYMCKQTQEQLQEKNGIARVCMIIEIITAILVLIFVYFAKKWTTDLAKRYDENNVTPSSYTLYIEISEFQSKIFDEIFYDKTNTNSSRG